MRGITEFFDNKFYIELIAASILFVVAIYTDSFVTIIIYLLYFIIMLEIVRAVMSFIREKRIQIRILIDAFIILTLREFIVNVMKINKETFVNMEALLTNTTNFHIMILTGVIVFLFALRWIAKLTSPDNDKPKD